MIAISCHDLHLINPARDSGAPPRTILDGVSLTVGAGELAAIVGPSGAGKSSLLACLAGLQRPTTGTVSLVGTEITRLGRSTLARFRLNHLVLVMQHDDLLSALTCRENVGLPRRLRRTTRLGRASGSRADAENTALAATGMTWAADHLPAALSGGERQRVAVSRMLATPSEIVFADEPTGSLDDANAARVLALLRERADAGSAVIMVTHDREAASRADRAIFLIDGRLASDGRASDGSRSNPEIPGRRFSPPAAWERVVPASGTAS